jgi:AcrR family transcriptional regulator
MPSKPLTRERILAAALTIVDREGLDAISMRRLGDALGVEAMSLYNHVANKAAILDGLFESILGELPVAPRSGTWQTIVRERARSLRRVLLSHPNALPIIATRVAVTTGSLHHLEAMLDVLREAGFGPRDAINVVQVTIAFVVGHTMASTADPDDDSQPDYAALPAAEFPRIHEVARLLPIDRERELEFGIDALVTGFERHRRRR